jgi:hypothetical protein
LNEDVEGRIIYLRRDESNEDVEGRIICLKRDELIKDVTRCFV